MWGLCSFLRLWKILRWLSTIQASAFYFNLKSAYSSTQCTLCIDPSLTFIQSNDTFHKTQSRSTNTSCGTCFSHTKSASKVDLCYKAFLAGHTHGEWTQLSPVASIVFEFSCYVSSVYWVKSHKFHRLFNYYYCCCFVFVVSINVTQ